MLSRFTFIFQRKMLGWIGLDWIMYPSCVQRSAAIIHNKCWFRDLGNMIIWRSVKLYRKIFLTIFSVELYRKIFYNILQARRQLPPPEEERMGGIMSSCINHNDIMISNSTCMIFLIFQSAQLRRQLPAEEGWVQEGKAVLLRRACYNMFMF